MYPFIRILGRDIGTYGLCMALGFMLAAVLAMRRGRKVGLIIEDLLIVAAFALGFAVIFGNVVYILVTYSPAQIIEFVSQGDFSFIGTGIVFYGGLIGGVLGALLGIRVANCGLSVIEYSVVPFIPLGHAIGRVGCVLAGCCHGFEYSGPFAIYYPASVLHLSPEQGYFPVQLLEAVINIGICVFLVNYGKKNRPKFMVLFAYLGMYAVARFFLEMLRGDAIRGVWYSLSTSQIISIMLLLVSVCGMLWRKHCHKQTKNNP